MYLEPNLQKATPKRALIALNSHPPKYLTGKKWITKGTIRKSKWCAGNYTMNVGFRESFPYHIWALQQGSRQYEICWGPVKSWMWLLGVKLSMEILLPDHKAGKETYETWCGPIQSYHLPRMSLKVDQNSQMCATHNLTYPILGYCIFCNWAVWSVWVNLKVKGSHESRSMTCPKHSGNSEEKHASARLPT